MTKTKTEPVEKSGYHEIEVPAVGEYPERPYSEAISPEHRESQ